MNSTDTIRALLASHPLFKDCSEALIEQAVAGCRLSRFEAGEEMKSYDDHPILCIISKGSAQVYTKEHSTDLLLRILRKGDTFGVATLFGHTGNSTITKITAIEATEAVCMSEETVRILIMNDPALAMRYIDFLADRIRFLNRRISCLGAGSAERKLCAWLDSVIPEGSEDDTYTLSLPMNRLAEALGLGRASLYRAFDELAAASVVIREGKTLRIPSRDALRHYGESC